MRLESSINNNNKNPITINAQWFGQRNQCHIYITAITFLSVDDNQNDCLMLSLVVWKLYWLRALCAMHRSNIIIIARPNIKTIAFQSIRKWSINNSTLGGKIMSATINQTHM